MSTDLSKGKGIRNAKQYLEGLRDDRDVWIHGEKVKDVTKHPGLSRGALTLAGFMDRQFDKQYSDVITYEDEGRTVRPARKGTRVVFGEARRRIS